MQRSWNEQPTSLKIKDFPINKGVFKKSRSEHEETLVNILKVVTAKIDLTLAHWKSIFLSTEKKIYAKYQIDRIFKIYP